MKWFGVDYRYVIAGVGAVFILAYEFVGTQSGEIQPDKQEAQNSKALSVEALNEKLASALTANSASLEGVKASVLGQDEKSNINVRLNFAARKGPSFTDAEKKYFKTFLLGLTCVEAPSYYDHSIGNVNYEFLDGEGTRFDSAKIQTKACLNFDKNLNSTYISFRRSVQSCTISRRRLSSSLKRLTPKFLKSKVRTATKSRLWVFLKTV